MPNDLSKEKLTALRDHFSARQHELLALTCALVESESPSGDKEGSSAVVSLLAGVLLISKFRRGKYRDARDYEVLVFGLPALAVGIGLGASLYIVGIPVLPDWFPPVFAAACQFLVFLLKVTCFCFFFVWVRWTIPRFRFDQLMNLGWKVMLPLAIANILITTILIYCGVV